MCSLGHGLIILINGVYISPSQPLHVYQAYCNTVEEASALTGVEAHSLLIGDFNLPGVNSAPPNSILPSAASRCIHEISTYLHCKQINNVHNINNTLLDLVFSSLHGSKVLQDPDPILGIDQHHLAVNVGLSVPAIEVS